MTSREYRERLVDLPGGPASIVDYPSVSKSAPTLVAIHGLPGSSRDFRHLPRHLGPSVRMVAVDLPGFGQSPVPRDYDPSPTGRARFVVQVMDALEIPQAVILGHSMGAVVACAMANAEDPRVQGVVLLGCPGLTPHRPMRLFPWARVHRILQSPLGALLFPAVRWVFSQWGFGRYSDDALRRTIEGAAATSMEGHARALRGLACPTFFGWADDDKIVEPSLMAEAAAICPPGPRLQFPSGGHTIAKTRAPELGEALTVWVNELAVQ